MTALTNPASPTRRRLLAGVALLALALAAPGCQQTQTNSGASPAPGATGAAGASPAAANYPVPPKPQGAFKIGLITPGSTKTDTSWSGPAYKGAQEVAALTKGTLTPPIEKPDPAAVAGAIRGLASSGNQLIFLHGSEYDDAAAQIAPDFPQTTFVVTGGRTVKPNLTPIHFPAGGATYLAGMVAGGMTKTNKIACVGGVEIPIVKEAFAAFTKGAHAVNPAADVRTVFLGDATDTGRAKQQTETLLAEGCDVIQHDADDAGAGVAQAVAAKPGTFFLGANSDQSDLATKQNLGSFVLDVPSAFVAAGKRVAEGKGDGKAIEPSAAERPVYFKLNDKCATPIPADLKAKVTQAEKDIASGKLVP